MQCVVQQIAVGIAMFGFSFGSGISSKYSIGQKHSFQAGAWSVSSGKRKNATSTNGSSAGDNAVSVFTFNKKEFANAMAESGLTSKRVLEEVYSRLRREVASLSKFRHPAVVRVIEPLQESKSSMTFVTEPLSGCLTSIIRARASGGDLDDGNDEFDDLAMQRGLLHITDALMFLHKTANAVHLDLQPSSILIDSKGDFKLAGMGFVENIAESKTDDFFLPQYDPRLPSFIQINLDYAAPDLVIDRKLDPANDIFSLGCLVLAIYTGKPPLDTHNQPSSYKQELASITRHFRDKKIPPYLASSVIPSLLSRSPFERLSLEAFRQSEYFDNPLVKAINFLDDFPARMPQEKKVFLDGMFQMLPQFPKPVKQKKILQALLDELFAYSGGASSPTPASAAKKAVASASSPDLSGSVLVYPLLKIILTIGKDMSQLSFAERILPAVRKVSKLKSCQLAVLDFLTIFRSRLNLDDYKKYILPVLFATLATAEPECQRDVLLKMNIITENLDFVCLKNEVYPAVAEPFSTTTSLAVKLEALNAFCVLIDRGLDKYMITEKLIPLLAKMKTRDPNIIMAALKVYALFKPIIDIEVLVTAVIPQLLVFSIDSSLTPSQFSSLMQEVRAMLEKLESDRKTKLVHNIEPSPSTSLSANVGASTAARSTTPVMDFNSLISQNSSSSSPATLPASSSNVFDTIQVQPSLKPSTNSSLKSTTTLSPSNIQHSKPFVPTPLSTSSFKPLTPSSTLSNSMQTTFQPMGSTGQTTLKSVPLGSNYNNNTSSNGIGFKPLQPLKSPPVSNSNTTTQPTFGFGSVGNAAPLKPSFVPSQTSNSQINDSWGDFHDSQQPKQQQQQQQQANNGLSQYQSLL